MQTSSGACVVGFLEERGDRLLPCGHRARAPRSRPPPASISLFSVGELVGGAAAGEDRVAFGGELARDGRTDEVAGADDGGSGIASLHGEPFRSSDVELLRANPSRWHKAATR